MKRQPRTLAWTRRPKAPESERTSQPSSVSRWLPFGQLLAMVALILPVVGFTERAVALSFRIPANSAIRIAAATPVPELAVSAVLPGGIVLVALACGVWIASRAELGRLREPVEWLRPLAFQSVALWIVALVSTVFVAPFPLATLTTLAMSITYLVILLSLYRLRAVTYWAVLPWFVVMVPVTALLGGVSMRSEDASLYRFTAASAISDGYYVRVGSSDGMLDLIPCLTTPPGGVTVFEVPASSVASVKHAAFEARALPANSNPSLFDLLQGHARPDYGLQLVCPP